MRRTAWVAGASGVVVAFALAAGGQEATGKVTLEELAWLAGHWVGSSEATVTEELWLAPAGGLMLGLHRDVAPGRPAVFEYLRIEGREHGPVYVASPHGGAATEFPLVAAGLEEVVFENPGHDFPRRIIYRREGNALIARIEGELEGHPRSAQWEWRLGD